MNLLEPNLACERQDLLVGAVHRSKQVFEAKLNKWVLESRAYKPTCDGSGVVGRKVHLTCSTDEAIIPHHRAQVQAVRHPAQGAKIFSRTDVRANTQPREKQITGLSYNHRVPPTWARMSQDRMRVPPGTSVFMMRLP